MYIYEKNKFNRLCYALNPDKWFYSCGVFDENKVEIHQNPYMPFVFSVRLNGKYIDDIESKDNGYDVEELCVLMLNNYDEYEKHRQNYFRVEKSIA